jgi:hypothetical protein
VYLPALLGCPRLPERLRSPFKTPFDLLDIGLSEIFVRAAMR